MNLLGKKVRDSVSGISGTVIGEAQYLHGTPIAMLAYGDKFDTEWLNPDRLTLLGADEAAQPASSPKALPPAKPAVNAAGPAKQPAAPPAAPGVPAATKAVDTYAQVAQAFITLGKAGQAPTIQAILKSHNAAHAKQIQDDPAALADVLAQARSAIAALQNGGASAPA
jgi:hypothetical protein